MTVRAATDADTDVLVALIGELAEYEHAADQVEVTADLLRAALFGPEPSVRAYVAVTDIDAPDIVGMALWYPTYSSWTGVGGLYLEDLYVRPAHRGAGHGRALLEALARTCAQRGWARMEWAVLDWNTPSIGFYRALGARPKDGWTAYRLSGPELRALGEGG